MAKLTILGSSSQGNCYILECKDITLVLEFGIPWKHILQGLNYNLDRKIVAVASHQHGDHMKKETLKSLNDFRIPVYSTKSAAAYHKNGLLRAFEDRKVYKYLSMEIMPLRVPHGDCECFSYLISHPEFGRLLFATDLTRFPYNISGINHLLIEANNDEEVMLDNAMKGKFSSSRSEDHMSLEHCIDALNRLKGPSTNNVVLIHLSSSNADPNKFQTEVMRQVGIKPLVAQCGMEIELNADDF